MTSTSPIYSQLDNTIYLVVDEVFVRQPVWREAGLHETDLDTIIQDLIDAQYNDPIRIVAFNTSENWAKDITFDVAIEIKRRFDRADLDVPDYLARLVGHRADL